MRDLTPEIEAAGAGVAAVGLGGFHYARAFRDEAGIDFPLLVDADRVAYTAIGLHRGNLLHVVRGDNRRARARARAAGHRQGKTGADPFQLGGSFAFAPGDRDLYAHVSETFGDNAPLADVVAALRVAD